MYGKAFNKYGGYLLSQVKDQVPSAMRDLTTLFGMGRGEHPRQNHHKILGHTTLIFYILERKKTKHKKIKLTGN